jgi:hypothetical protein
MYLVTVAFLVDNETGSEPMPDFAGKHKMYPTGQQITNLGDNFFCVKCGQVLKAVDVARAINNTDFYTSAEYVYQCEDCLEVE